MHIETIFLVQTATWSRFDFMIYFQFFLTITNTIERNYLIRKISSFDRVSIFLWKHEGKYLLITKVWTRFNQFFCYVNFHRSIPYWNFPSTNRPSIMLFRSWRVWSKQDGRFYPEINVMASKNTLWVWSSKLALIRSLWRKRKHTLTSLIWFSFR